jgi:hypothetical protein
MEMLDDGVVSSQIEHLRVVPSQNRLKQVHHHPRFVNLSKGDGNHSCKCEGRSASVGEGQTGGRIKKRRTRRCWRGTNTIEREF